MYVDPRTMSLILEVGNPGKDAEVNGNDLWGLVLGYASK